VILVHIPWHVNPFRGDKFAEGWASAAEAALDFGAVLRGYRTAAGLSQEALAEAGELSPRAIRALERGERRAPHRDTVRLLAIALRLPAAERARLAAAARPSRNAQNRASRPGTGSGNPAAAAGASPEQSTIMVGPGGGAYSRHSPYGFWLEDVPALGFLRPPWGMAADLLFESSWDTRESSPIE
jgi:transcriptional regulator with XRE-family HTH domain